MRQKDIKYYCNALLLRFHAWRFRSIRHLDIYKNQLEVVRLSYQKHAEELTPIHTKIPHFYYTYAPLSWKKEVHPKTLFNAAYHWQDNMPIGLKGSKMFDPIIPFYYGMLLWNYFCLNQEDETLSTMISLADKMIERKEEISIGAVYKYDSSYPLFDLPAGWIGGSTQALACSFYMRLYHQTKNENYKQAAINLFKPLLIPQTEGGLLAVTQKGMEWVEAFPSSKPSLALHGHIFAIAAAWDMYDYLKDDSYLFTYNGWQQALQTHLVEYIFDRYIVHNKYQNKLSNIEYQGLYVGQFLHLAQITHNHLYQWLFMHFYNNIKWDRYYTFYGQKQHIKSTYIHMFKHHMDHVFKPTN